MTESLPVDRLTTAALPAAISRLRAGSTPTGMADELRIRQKAALEWRDAAEAVASLIDLPEADEAVDYLKSECLLGYPVDLASGNIFVLLADGDSTGGISLDRLSDQIIAKNQAIALGQPGPYAEGACLVPWVESDQISFSSLQRRKVIGREYNYGSAYFASSTDMCTGDAIRTLFLPSLRSVPRLSEYGRGITLLYQTRYALTRQAVNQKDLSPAAYWLDESKLFKFEFDVMERLCGDTYTDMVEPHAESLRVNKDTLDKPGDVLNRRRKKALRKVFAGAQDPELHVWNGVAERNALMDYHGGVERHGRYLHHVARTGFRG